MNVAIVHYHLNRGGVTRAIANHLWGMEAAMPPGETARIALLYGGRCEGWAQELGPELRFLEVQYKRIPFLDYDDGIPRPAELARQMGSSLQELGFTAESCLLHVHNHALGKNVSLPGALMRLAKSGFRLLLQLHDFAEDFRPQNYCRLVAALARDNPAGLSDILYPQGAGIHYAVLNRRDARILRRARFSPQQLHVLPNAALPMGPPLPKEDVRRIMASRFGVADSSQLLVYPIRGIRRKNIGEAALWSVLAGQRAAVAVTLAPLNPLELPSYEAWKRLARRLGLPMVFDVGAAGALSLRENLAAADFILTTSVAEGFGMVFLESWLAGRPLVGRDLPEVTADFADAGLRLCGLYPSLDIPLEWIGEDPFRSMLTEAYCEVQQAYRLPPLPPAEIQKQIDARIDRGNVDFAALSPALQARTIEWAHGHWQRRQQLLERNPWISRAMTEAPDQDVLLRHNAQIVAANYSIETIGRELLRVYRQILAGPPSGSIDAQADGSQILNAFLDISRIHPLRLAS